METHSIVKSHYRGYEVTLAALVSRVLSVLDKMLPEESLIATPKEKTSRALAVLNKAIGRVRKNAFTLQLAAKDGNRDTLYQALVRRVESDMFRIDEPLIAANADALNSIIVENGKAKERGYLDQTNQLEKLFDKLSTPENMQLLVENAINGIYDALVQAQTEFRDMWTASVESESAKETILPLREAADTLMNIVNRSLFRRLDIGAEDIGDRYTSVIAMINEAIDQTATVQRSRIARHDRTDEPVTDAAAS